MKTNLLKILRILLFPLLWCRMVLQEASQACCNYDPVGLTDYMNFVSPEEAPRHVYKAERPLSGVTRVFPARCTGSSRS